MKFVFFWFVIIEAFCLRHRCDVNRVKVNLNHMQQQMNTSKTTPNPKSNVQQRKLKYYHSQQRPQNKILHRNRIYIVRLLIRLYKCKSVPRVNSPLLVIYCIVAIDWLVAPRLHYVYILICVE